MDEKGALYGTTVSCGSSNDGIVWKVSKKGTETVLYNFGAASYRGHFLCRCDYGCEG